VSERWKTRTIPVCEIVEAIHEHLLRQGRIMRRETGVTWNFKVIPGTLDGAPWEVMYDLAGATVEYEEDEMPRRSRR